MRLPVNNAVITSPYGNRILNGVPQFHDGIDFISGSGDESVHAIADGNVILDFDGYEEASRWTEHEMSGGNYVVMKHVIAGLTYYVRYIHIAENFVFHGMFVHEGLVIGKYGDVGYSYGAHVHIDAYDITWKKINITDLFRKGGLA